MVSTVANSEATKLAKLPEAANTLDSEATLGSTMGSAAGRAALGHDRDGQHQPSAQQGYRDEPLDEPSLPHTQVTVSGVLRNTKMSSKYPHTMLEAVHTH